MQKVTGQVGLSICGRRISNSLRVQDTVFRNRNHSDWWIASYIERFEYYDEDKSNTARRCLAWENTVLIRARSREQAYRKAVALGRLSNGNEGWNSEKRRGAWRFEGLTELLPIYEELMDGAEILWKEHRNRTVKTVKSLVKRKRDLSVFNDREEKVG